MRRYFIDTNVLIDFLVCRESYAAAAELLARAKAGEYGVCTSVLSMANLAYILRKVLKGDVLYDTFSKMSFMDIVPMTAADYSKAVALRSRDFEDTLQYYSAMSFGCDAIITRNIKDFPFAEIPIISPADFVKG